jgi:peptidoglycan/LPS O-acetylase OafA/YrhL
LSEGGAPSPALTPPAGNPRFPLMDAVRGIGSIAVVLAHAYGHNWRGAPQWLDNLTEGLSVAPPVFFALSGFLLFRPYLASQALGAPAPRLRDFWLHRVLRIIPGYWVALTVLALFLGPELLPGTFGHHWWLLYGLGQSYSVTENFNGIAVAWTLSVEASFYLVLPLLAAASVALAGRHGWKRAALVVTVPLLVLGPVVHALNTITTFDHTTTLAIQRMVYAAPGMANFFAVGMLLAILSVAAEAGERPHRAIATLVDRPGLTWRIAFVLWLVYALAFGFPHEIFGLNFPVRFIVGHVMVTVIIFLIMLPATFDVHDGPIRRLLSWRPVVVCGVLSFGTYLYHEPLLRWMEQRAPLRQVYEDWALVPRVSLLFVVAMSVALAAAWISYRCVELPYLRLKRTAR